MIDLDIVRSLRESGKTYEQIGQHFGISRQAAYSAINRSRNRSVWQFCSATYLAIRSEKQRAAEALEGMGG